MILKSNCHTVLNKFILNYVVLLHILAILSHLLYSVFRPAACVDSAVVSLGWTIDCGGIKALSDLTSASSLSINSRLKLEKPLGSALCCV